MRRFEGEELVVATHNPGKAREIRDLLKEYVGSVVSADDLGLPEPEETGASFTENAVLKAKAAAMRSGRPALADDSGLAVDALGGDPGIYSARWGGPEKDFDLAMKKVHNALGDNPNRKAAFICVLTLAWPDGHSESFEGKVAGTISWPPRGNKGFGYDPVFIPDGYDKTFAEMEPEFKHSISHRANAFKKMIKYIFT